MIQHDFQELTFNGATVRSCRLCACTADSPQGKEDCRGKIAQQAPSAPIAPIQKPFDMSMIRSLDVVAIEAKIGELSGEIAALKVLLKAAKAKGRHAKKQA